MWMIFVYLEFALEFLLVFSCFDLGSDIAGVAF